MNERLNFKSIRLLSCHRHDFRVKGMSGGGEESTKGGTTPLVGGGGGGGSGASPGVSGKQSEALLSPGLCSN